MVVEVVDAAQDARGSHSVGATLDTIVGLLADRRAELDGLNVFPVPDADTGANVLATLAAARDGAAGASTDSGRHAAEAAVRGARGNSGVVLAQVLRALLGGEDLLGDDLADRLRAADDLARAAVATPVEGSVLTAVTDAAAAATTVAADGGDGLAQLRAAVVAAHGAVRESPTRNPVLGRAGVVDAGARAFALVLEGLVSAATGEAVSPPDVEVPPDGPRSVACGASSGPEGGRYELMFLVEEATVTAVDGGGDALGAVAERLRDRLTEVGDSVVVVAGDHVLSVHVHTDEIGAALAAGVAVGDPSEVRVEDLRAATGGDAARTATPSPAPGPDAAIATTKVLVGAAASGLRELVTAHGAAVLPLGDETWTPVRLAALLGAAADAPVVLVPGREDVADAADEAVAAVRAVTDAAIEVVDGAVGPGEVVSALAVLDPRDPDAGALTVAVASTRTGSLAAGAAAHDCAALAASLAAGLDHDAELVTVLLGAQSDLVAEGVVAAVTRALPGVEVEIVPDAVVGGVHVVVE